MLRKLDAIELGFACLFAAMAEIAARNSNFC